MVLDAYADAGLKGRIQSKMQHHKLPNHPIHAPLQNGEPASVWELGSNNKRVGMGCGFEVRRKIKFAI